MAGSVQTGLVAPRRTTLGDSARSLPRPNLLLFVTVFIMLQFTSLFGNEWLDPGFEDVSQVGLESEKKDCGWEVRSIGRDEIKDNLRVDVVTDPTLAKAGRQCVMLSIPQNTVGFEWASIGQKMFADPKKEYEASVWVRWVDGPDAAPEGAGATTKTKSAIISFWARHRDGKAEFAGMDQWLFDNKWKKLGV